MKQTRIAIVDDHRLVAVAIESFLEEAPDLVCVRHTATVAEMTAE